MKSTNTSRFSIETHTTRLEASHRGGGIEIALDSLGIEGGRMSAYQNYLGGGMLGSIANDCNVEDWKQNKGLVDLANRLARHFHEITRHSDDEWEDCDFEANQSRSASAY